MMNTRMMADAKSEPRRNGLPRDKPRRDGLPRGKPLKRISSKLSNKIAECRGQMMVELCVVFPVVIVIAVIATNALSFFGYCAEFDRISRNAVRTYATAPAHGQATDESVALVSNAVESAFDASNLQCEVTANKDYRGYETYDMTLKFTPTLFGLGLQTEVFGVSIPQLKHTSHLTVNPYKPGMLF